MSHRFLAGFIPTLSRYHPARMLLAVLLLYVLVWLLLQNVAATNLDNYGDMLENYAWGQVLEWGSFKHPPLFAWVTGWWFRLTPDNDVSYRLLAYLNAAVGLAGVYQLAIAMRMSSLALPAVLLLSLAFPYSTLAAKFNANAVLLSIWPWVAVAWWYSLHPDSARGARNWSIAFGVLGALAMLGKYYSGVFLLALFLASFSFAAGRDWLRSSRPWLTLFVFVLCLLPHLQWLRMHDFVTLRYVGEQGDGHIVWRHILRFALSPILYWCLPWLLCCWLFDDGEQGWRGWSLRLFRCWAPRSWSDGLFWLAIVPWLITLLFGLAGVVELSLPWAIPIGFAFPLLWLRNLCMDKEGIVLAERVATQSRKLLQAYLIILLLLFPLALLQGWREATQGSDNYYLPRQAAAKALLEVWHSRYPDQKLVWVGGQWGENALLAFYGDSSLRILPGLPDQFPATLSPLTDWRHKPGLLLCPAMPMSPASQADCDSQMQDWLHGQAQDAAPIVVSVARTGWRFPMAHSYTYHAYAYLPVKDD